MKIWLINPYGNLPSEGWRDYRTTMLARTLASRGHEVIWWISDFEHRSKSYRGSGELRDQLLPEGVRVIGVHSTAYRNNISLMRVRYEINYGLEFARMAIKESPPDVIVLADPALFFSAPVLAYRERVGCKLVLDVIDLWPELFTVALPKLLQPLARLIFFPLYRRRMNLINQCDAVVAVSQDYLCAALQGQVRKIPSLVSYLGIDVRHQRLLGLNSFLDEKLSKFRIGHSLVAVYAGTIGDAYDIDILIDAVVKSAAENNGLGFIVAGDGPRRRDVEVCSMMYPNHLLFLGTLPPDDLKTLYKNADVGLMTYVQGSTVAMPVKFFDYLVSGIAVLSSLHRDVRQIINEQHVGMNYQAGDLIDFLRCLNSMKEDRVLLQLFKAASYDLASKYDIVNQYDNFSCFVERACSQ